MRSRIANILLIMALAMAVGCNKDDLSGLERTRDVNIYFILNLPASSSATKQSGSEAQAGTGSLFRGISECQLQTTSQDKDGMILVKDKTMQRAYDLSTLLGEGSVNSVNSRRIMEMSLPLGTNTMVFYGRSIKGSTVDGFTPKECYGHLDVYQVDTVGGESANFQLGKRLTEKAKYLTTGKVLAGVMTLIMNTPLGSATVGKTECPEGCTVPYGYDLSMGDYKISWKSYADDILSPVETSPSHNLYPLEEKMAMLYKQMTTIQTDNLELRAGSGEATLRVIQDLWSVINYIRCSTPSSVAEAVAKYYADCIHRHISLYFQGTVPGDGTAVVAIDYRPIEEIKDALLRTGAPWPVNFPDALKPSTSEMATISGSTIRVFPRNFNLPYGAAFIAYSTSGQYFFYPEEFQTAGMGFLGDTYSIDNYYYPAELLYFSNSPIRTSSKERKDVSFPDGTVDWNKDASWGKEWDEEHVSSNTRSVAMKFDVNYGVALLESRIAYATTTLEDNRHNVLKLQDASQDISNQEISVNDKSFRFTGLVVGGQPRNVGWNFLVRPTPEDPTKTTYGFVYDSAVHEEAQTIPADVSKTSQPNYTVLFDNYTPAETQRKVRVALEFQNNTGADFYGNYNIIRNGGYFYILAELDPAKYKTNITWPADGSYVIPPYKDDGTSQKVSRVFVQDYLTKATFKFAKNSLQYAYLTVPDLRVSSLTMGLSVDVEWTEGHKYENVLVGGNPKQQ